MNWLRHNYRHVKNIIREKTMIRRKTTIIAIATVCLALVTSAALSSDSEDYRIRLGAADFIPTVEVVPSALPAGFQLVQFYELPDSQQRALLDKTGMRFVRYVSGNAYMVEISKGISVSSGTSDGIRAILPLTASMRTSSVLVSSGLLELWRDSDGDIAAHVVFQDSVSFKHARKLLRGVGAKFKQEDFMNYAGVEILAPWPAIEQLLNNNLVELIEPKHPEPALDNVWSAKRSRTDQVRGAESFGNPSGEGVMVGVWDGGTVDQLEQFDGRISNAFEGYKKSLADHTAHVSGTIAGAGNAHGMAPEARIVTYDFHGNVVKEVKDAINEYGIILTSNSWSTRDGWLNSGVQIEGNLIRRIWLGGFIFGHYSSASRAYDRLVREYNIGAFFSAGNNRGIGQIDSHVHLDVDGTATDVIYHDFHPSNPDWGAITGFNLAKNVITVGATMDDDNIGFFSSTGPVDNGRVKPDLVANGWNVLSTINDGSLAYFSGTSMSTPATAGASALLQDIYKDLHGEFMGADMLKAVLINGARDLGNPGPDYLYGHGHLDTFYSAQVIQESAKSGTTAMDAAMISRGQLDNKQQSKSRFIVPAGVKDLRVTLVWNDVPGPGLINDLDVIAVDPEGTKHYPFVLDPENPEATAERGRNSIDNVENLRVENPIAGTWRIIVKGERVPSGPQEFALVVSAGQGSPSFPVKKRGKLGDIEIYTTGDLEFNEDPKEVFTRGDVISVSIKIGIIKNAKINNVSFGTLGYVLRIFDENRLYVQRAYGSSFWESGSELKHLRGGVGSDSMRLTDEMPAGEYTFEVIVFMHNGETKSKRTTFRIE